MTIALIVAAGKDGIIGKDGDLPWHFPSDLKFFKQTTMGHPVLMGRITYDSILKRLGKPLPGRQNIIVTRNKNFKDDRVTVIHDVGGIKDILPAGETLFVIGGAQIYRDTLPKADIVYLTRIDLAVPGGDAFFPTLELHEWHLAEETAGFEEGVSLRWCKYIRKAPHIDPKKDTVSVLTVNA